MNYKLEPWAVRFWWVVAACILSGDDQAQKRSIFVAWIIFEAVRWTYGTLIEALASWQIKRNVEKVAHNSHKPL